MLFITTGETDTAWHILSPVTGEVSHSHLHGHKRVKHAKGDIKQEKDIVMLRRQI